MKRILASVLALALIISSVVPANAVIIPTRPVSGEPDAATVKAATESLKNMSAKEKKAKLKQVSKAVKEFKAAKKAKADISENTLLLVIIAILLPPLAVFLHQGEINSKFWIALLLTLLFYLPGLIYALIVIFGEA